MPFDVIPSKIDEPVGEKESTTQIVMGLALEKALDISKSNHDALVIASDTVVYFERILGKPKSREEARDMLKALSGEKHEVYTGIALVHFASNRKVVDYVCTEVTFNALSDAEIDVYLNTGEAYDKAGAYGIQGYGALLVSEIKGDYFNVMGLPLSKLNSMLKIHFQLDLLV
jgi:septum formation protein